MHTSEYEDGDSAMGTKWWARFHHNGGYEGDVVVVVPSDTAEMTLSHNEHTVSVRVPYEAMERLVLDKLRGEFINKLETLGYEALAEYVKYRRI
jgi:hypothetical protein